MKPRELNVVRKKRAAVRVALLYPSTYEVSLSSLSYQMLYYALNSYRDVAAERVVAGEGLASLETGLLLKRFRVILVPLHYEVNAAEAAGSLWRAGIHPLAEKRGDTVVVAGGPPVTANPEPYAEIFDAMVIGEAGPVLPGLVDAFTRCDEKRCILEELAGLRGVYVPSIPVGRVDKAYVASLDDAFHPVAQIQSLDREPLWGRGFMVETGRGCFRGCRFCMEGHVFLPRRERSAARVKQLVEAGVDANNVGKAVFYDLAFLDHRGSEAILEHAVEELGLQVSVPSLRIDALTPRHAELIARGGQRTLTVAPETPLACLGRAINKHIPCELAAEKVRMASGQGIRMFKLYYMVGLPGEPRSIVDEIAREVGVLRGAAGPGAVLKVSVTPFIPKPHTPLQWAPMAPLAELREKIRSLGRALRRAGIGYSAYDPRWARIQAAIARGGRELGRLIARWGMLGGGLGAWRRALRELGISEDRLLRPPSIEEEPPWSIVDLGVPVEALRKGYEAYLEAAEGCR